jgi:hypothetical protein
MKSIFNERDARDLEARLGRMTPDCPRRWGRMDAHGAVCHLSDAFRVVMGGATSDFRADTLFNRTVGRLVALSLPVPWPKGLPTSPECDQERSGTAPAAFAADVAALQALMRRFRGTGGRDLPPHVALGPLSPGEWGRWGYRHMDHHLRQFGL